ncbi:hypothetical protein GMORB2_4626 [Geosmithia morbida]|uniref:Uncharacterized protein n=1 Tax=Geosmithia morbida TaxID=1094350 RepID=A0A9P4YM41_9HYPO|nr:uncharacterized protein GMORB2_4626 [Geosmithia morbida]KAF4119496.1 hypothetical protein GMORB2_4626 [Geosmithia morbida]
MATTTATPNSTAQQAQRRRPFSTWVKKLTNFKSSSDGEGPRRNMKKKKRNSKANNPYPESGTVSGYANNHDDSSVSAATGQGESSTSLEQSSRPSTTETNEPPATGTTASTDHDAPRSIKAPSHGTSSVTGTNHTVGGGLDSRKGGDSTFSSPAPSVQSLATTLTTIQSVAQHAGGGPNSSSPASGPSTQNNAQSIQFSQPFPSTSPASAIPAHLAPNGAPNTYVAATANGLLTDNASILTLASSSKRRRRRSMDTDASVRALAPSSVWGGSRESLPLSVLSANIESSAMASTPALHSGTARERNSIYSSTGIPPAIQGDRSSYYAKQGDAASIRSGRPGHSRTESMTGVNTAGPSSPLAGPPASEKSDITEKVDENAGDEAGGQRPTKEE